MANAAIGRSREDEARRIRREEDRRRLERLALAILNLAVLSLATLLVALMCCGCCNIMERTEPPYALAPEPYYCTAEAAAILAEPFAGRSGPDGIAGAAIAVTYPVWIVSGILDLALDTVFLPADAVYKLTTTTTKED